MSIESFIFYEKIFKKVIISADCNKIIRGNPIINLLCLVLWRIIFIVKYIKMLPPITLIIINVFSLILLPSYLALILSKIQISDAKIFIAIK